ncbi:DUF2142 domain-containing protein [Enterococcus faecalis]
MGNLFEKPEKIFLLLAPLFIGVSLFLMPLNRVPDEASHARITWAILHEKSDKSIDWMEWDSKKVKVNRQEYRKLFTEKLDFSNEKFRVQFPLKRIMHIPQLIGMTIGQVIYPSMGVMVMAGRIMNALFYIVSLYFIIKKIKFGKLALMFLALLPIMVQQAASMSYDVVNNVLIFGFLAVLSDLYSKRKFTKKNLSALLVITFGLCVTKLNNLFLLVLLLPLNINFEGRWAIIGRMWERCQFFVKKYRYILLSSSFIISLFLAMLYFKDKGGITQFTQVMLNTIFDNNVNPQLNTIIVTGMFGYLGVFDFQLPMWLIMIDIAVLTILLMKKEEIKLGKTFGVLSGLMLPLQVVVVIGGMYFAWTPLVLGKDALISVGAQGRYFTPFLIYLSPLFISFKNKMSIEANEKSLTKFAVFILLLNFLITLYLILLVYWYPHSQAEWLINLRKSLVS